MESQQSLNQSEKSGSLRLMPHSKIVRFSSYRTEGLDRLSQALLALLGLKVVSQIFGVLFYLTSPIAEYGYGSLIYLLELCLIVLGCLYFTSFLGVWKEKLGVVFLIFLLIGLEFVLHVSLIYQVNLIAFVNSPLALDSLARYSFGEKEYYRVVVNILFGFILAALSIREFKLITEDNQVAKSHEKKEIMTFCPKCGSALNIMGLCVNCVKIWKT
ncbi:MAG: hypothetical protein ACFFBD_15600 [Candidatus Hodarchaeota archaeon]